MSRYRRLKSRLFTVVVAIVALLAVSTAAYAVVNWNDTSIQDPGPVDSNWVWDGTVTRDSSSQKHVCVSLTEDGLGTPGTTILCSSQINNSPSGYNCSLAVGGEGSATHWQLVLAPNSSCGGTGSWEYGPGKAFSDPSAVAFTDLAVRNLNMIVVIAGVLFGLISAFTLKVLRFRR